MNNQKILVIEDEPDLQEIYQDVLTEAGFEVEAVEMAEDALSKLENGSEYKLILLDLRLPKMTGIEFLRLIRNRHYGYDSMKTVILSGVDMPDIEMITKACGAADYWKKVDLMPSDLIEKVTKILNVN